MSDPRWNLEPLREHVRQLGHDFNDPLSQTIRSVDRSIVLFHYHVYTARDALKGHINKDEPQGSDNFMLLLGASARQEEFARTKVVSEAHIIACLHTTRSLYDIFSHVVNRLLLSSQLPVGQCDIYKVRDALPSGPLRSALDDLIGLQWFKYIQAFINTAKHRQLIVHSVTISMEENRVGIRLGAFEYKGDRFPQYWDTEVLTGAFEVKNKIVLCGRALNAACGVSP
jgi:hypothetical protein